MRDFSKAQDSAGLPVPADVRPPEIPVNLIQITGNGAAISHTGTHENGENMSLPLRSAQGAQLRRAGKP